MTARRLPVTRGDCADGPRPCRHACRHRLEGAESCALDVADRGGITRDEIGALLGMTRVAVAQAEKRAVRRLCARLGVPVPSAEDYESDASAIGAIRAAAAKTDASDALAFDALVRMGSGSTVDLAVGMGKHHSTAYDAIHRLFDTGRVTRKKAPGKNGAFIYSPVHSEAAE